MYSMHRSCVQVITTVQDTYCYYCSTDEGERERQERNRKDTWEYFAFSFCFQIMVEIVEEVRVHPVPVPIIGQQRQQRQHNIVSGESEDIFSTDDDDEEDEEGQAYLNSTRSKRNDKDNNNNDHDPADLLYDENLDDLDEAYVYKNMRGGIRESVTVLTGQPTTTKSGSSSNTATATTAATEDNPAADGENGQGRRRQSVQVYKPRSSDAVLSCPCCFNIVCMDCQKHKRYPNQYRAMFVMGVVVDWNNILVYDDTHRVLVPNIVYQEEGEGDNNGEQGEHHQHQNQQQHSISSFGATEVEKSLKLDASQTTSTSTSIKQKQNNNNQSNFLRAKCGEYYSVECSTCRTQVAALDMTDEVYHFHGCLESSSAF